MVAHTTVKRIWMPAVVSGHELSYLDVGWFFVAELQNDRRCECAHQALSSGRILLAHRIKTDDIEGIKNRHKKTDHVLNTEEQSF